MNDEAPGKIERPHVMQPAPAPHTQWARGSYTRNAQRIMNTQ